MKTQTLIVLSALTLLPLSGCSADPEALVERAESRLQANNYAAARPDLIAALESRPNNTRLMTMLARAELAYGNGGAALRHIERLRELDALPKDAVLLEAEALVQMQDFGASLAKLEGNDTAEAARIRALALVGLGRFDDARDALRAGLGGEGPKARLMADYALFRLADGEMDEARDLAVEALRADPAALDPMVALARIDEASGDDKAAAAMFAKAHAAYPNNRAAMFGHIRSLAASGKIDEAAPIIERAYADTPGNLEIAFLKARLEAEHGRAGAARKVLQADEQRLAQYPPAQLLYARLLLREGQAELAHKHLASMNLRFPDNSEVAGLLANVKLERGDRKGAARVLRPIANARNAPREIITAYNRAQDIGAGRN